MKTYDNKKYQYIIIEFTNNDFIIDVPKKPHTVTYLRMRAAHIIARYEATGLQVETVIYTNNKTPFISPDDIREAPRRVRM